MCSARYISTTEFWKVVNVKATSLKLLIRSLNGNVFLNILRDQHNSVLCKLKMTSYMVTTQSPGNGLFENVTETGRSQKGEALLDVANKLNIFILVVIMLGLGCSLSFKQVVNFLKRPKEFFTGIFIQLLVMPLIGLTTTQMLGMTVPETLGAFIQSIAPGGAYSNLVTYWLDGDLDLSVIMTITTNLLSLGSMPLWLFIISKILKLDQHLLVPYVSVVTGLVMAIIPLLSGIVLGHFFPKISPIFTKITSIVGSIGIIVSNILLGLAGTYDYAFSYKIFLAAAIMITAALSFGYAASRLPCINLKSSCRRTIAIETAYQSVPVAFSIIVLSFRSSAPETFQPMSFFPMFYGILLFGCSAVVIIVYSVLKAKGVKCFLPDDDRHETEPAEESAGTRDALMKV